MTQLSRQAAKEKYAEDVAALLTAAREADSSEPLVGEAHVLQMLLQVGLTAEAVFRVKIFF